MGGAVMVLANLAGLTTERDTLASGGIRFETARIYGTARPSRTLPGGMGRYLPLTAGIHWNRLQKSFTAHSDGAESSW